MAWNVSYTPGTIEAHGFKDGKLVMTSKQETTGPAAKLAMHADRRTISADGEDVAMIAVDVRDAQDRVVPITGNEIAFTVSGSGRLIGAGNGDPTDQESDKGEVPKGLLRALHGDRPIHQNEWRDHCSSDIAGSDAKHYND